MKKFIVKLLLFLTPIILFSVPLDFLLSKSFSRLDSTPFVAGEISVWNDIYKKNIDSEIAIYGSSRAWVQFNSTLIENELGHNTYNFGIDGHNFWLQYLRHKEYIQNNKSPKVIILSVDHTTLQKRKDLFNYNQFLPYMLWNKNIMKYTSDYKSDFQHHDYLIPILRYKGKFSLIKKSISPPTRENKKRLKRERGFQGMDKEWNNDLLIARRKRGNFKAIIDKKTIELLDRFLTECAETNITVLMVYAPFYHEGLEFIENNNEVLEILHSLATANNLDFLDYSKDDISYNKAYFYNSSHLNNTGADLFTKKLIKDIQDTKAFARLKQ